MSLSPPSSIAAISTAVGGGIGIVRVSGPAAEEIGRRLCSPWPAELISHHLYVGTVATPAPQGGPDHREPLDQVLFCLMRGPRSFTGEDVLEIHGHGGAVNLRRILEATVAVGATLAEAGEFTRRAFFAGKLDLTRAEAMAALIGATSIRMARQAQRQMGGELGNQIAGLRRRLLNLLARVEGSLDFPELAEDSESGPPMEEALLPIIGDLSRLSKSYHQLGRGMDTGLHVAVLGRPNVGKSSLINALCGAERAVVDAEPGTTRDFIETQTEWASIQVTMIDTAGERAGGGLVERQGIRLGREQWRKADLVLYVADGETGLLREDEELLGSLETDMARLIVWNKIDALASKIPPPGVVCCSALCGWGLVELRDRALKMMLPQEVGAEEVVVVNSRQAGHLANGLRCLERALEQIRVEGGNDLVAAELRHGVGELALVVGEGAPTALLDAVFSQFCIGK